MPKSKFKYDFINVAVLLITLVLLVKEYWNIGDVFAKSNILRVLIITITAFVVHIVKAGRLYLALYGSDMRLLDYLKVYCKVVPVSVLFPFKLGEFFRMYCYGKALNNSLKGIVIVLLDRFMDTIALVTMIFLVIVFEQGEIGSFTYILLIFLVAAFLAYLAFPGVYKFWKKYILKAKATERKLYALKILDKLNHIYEEIKSVSQGRGIILYVMSLIAWGVEIGSLTLQVGLSGDSHMNQIVSEYLVSAMRSGRSIELKQFVLISVIVMIAIYVFLKGRESYAKRGERK